MTHESVVSKAVEQIGQSPALFDAVAAPLLVLLFAALVLHWFTRQARVPLRDE